MKIYSKLLPFMMASLFSLIKITIESQIMGADPYLDYSNSKYLSNLGIKMKLNYPLLRNDYLKMVFPFPLHNSLSAGIRPPGVLSRPKNLLGFWTIL
jgi:hypothetical protein